MWSELHSVAISMRYINQEEGRSCWSVESSRPGSSHGVVSSSPGVWQDLWGLQLLSYRIVCYESKHKATFVCISGSRSLSLETGCHSASIGWPQRLYLCHSSLFFGRYCWERCFQQGSPWFSSPCSGPKKSGLLICYLSWWKNLLSSPCCGTCWFSLLSRSSILAWRCCVFTIGNCDLTVTRKSSPLDTRPSS